MSRSRGKGTKVIATAVVALAVVFTACASYEETSRPICGDRLLAEGFECALWPAPCGCDATKRCSFSDGKLACVTPGSKGVDAPATSDAECAKGTAFDHTRCRKTCFEALDCGNDRAVLCQTYSDDKENTLVALCHRDCDPVSPAAPFDPALETCRPDETCTVDVTNIVASCVHATGTIAVGKACKEPTDCVPGAECIATADGNGICQKLCWPDGPNVCPSGTTCGEIAAGDTKVQVFDRTLGACQ